MDPEKSAPASPNSPVPLSRLSEITTEACSNTFGSVAGYEHAQTSEWNTTLINTVLQQLITETSEAGQQPHYKFTVTSTILQHGPPVPKSQQDTESKEGAAEGVTATGKRGMHSATGAFWNNEKDGMWSHKHEEEKKGFDVVISIVWISTL